MGKDTSHSLLRGQRGTSCRTDRRCRHVKAVSICFLLIVGVATPFGSANAVSASFVPTGPLSVGRYDEAQNLVRLCDGSLLVTGGATSSTYTASAERYSEAAGTWTPVAPMLTPRVSHSATLLDDCRVLVAGGASTSNPSLQSSEIYDPTTDSWTFVGSLNVGRNEHAAFRLPNGKVLVAAGGVPGPGGDTSGTTSAELYDPATQSWSVTGPLGTARINQSAAQLPDGRVLVVGGMPHGAGYFGQGFDTAELYDQTTGTWTYTTGTMATGRRGGQSLTTLRSGKVLVVGGHINASGDSTDLAEIFDPTTGVWTPTTPIPSARQFQSATLLFDGNVLLAGGWNHGWLDTAFVYHATGGSWTPTSSNMLGPRDRNQTARLSNGSVLFVGGLNGGPSVLASAEIYVFNFAFDGFRSPVDNLPALNVTKAGSAIPVKFGLGGNQGLAIIAPGSPTSKTVTCGATATEDVVEVTVTAGSSSLSYDPQLDQYNYVWKTEKAWGGTCRTLTIKLIDGTIHQANFKFAK